MEVCCVDLGYAVEAKQLIQPIRQLIAQPMKPRVVEVGDPRSLERLLGRLLERGHGVRDLTALGGG